MKQSPDHHQYPIVSKLNFHEYIRWRVAENLEFQKSFLYDKNDQLLVDYVGKYENLQHDFDEICDKIGLPKMNLLKLNPSNHTSYQEYYNEESEELVYSAFQKDFDAFGYSRMQRISK
jgi:hypothetical protein